MKTRIWPPRAGRVLIGAALLGAVLAGVRFAPQWIERRIREEITAVAASLGLESSAGTIAVDWRRARVRVSPIAIFGARGPGEPALLEIRSLEVGLRWNALWRGRVELDSVAAEGPRAAILFRADGSTNLPLQMDGQNPDRMFDLALSHIALTDGELRVGDRRIRLDVVMEGVRSDVRFDAARRAYTGQLTADRIRGVPVPCRLDAMFEIHPDRADLTSFRIESAHSRVEGSASFRNWQRLEGEFRARLTALVNEVRSIPRWDFVDGGYLSAEITGVLRDAWRLMGPVRLQGTRLNAAGQRLDQLNVSAESTWSGPDLHFRDLVIEAKQGRVTGAATVRALRDYTLDLSLNGFPAPEGLSTTVSGPLHIRGGARGLVEATARLDLVPGRGPGLALSGRLDLEADVSAQRLRFGPSEIHTGQTTLRLSGELDRQLDAQLRCGRWEDLRAIAAALGEPLPDWPVKLTGPAASFDGAVTGKGEQLRVGGVVRTGAVEWDGIAIDSFRATIAATPAGLDVPRAEITHRAGRVTGSASAEWRNWRFTEDSGLTAEVNAAALRLASIDSRLAGTGSLQARVTGTWPRPEITGHAQVRDPRWNTWRADRVSASFAGTPRRLEWSGVSIERGRDRLRGSGVWSPDEIRAAAATESWDLAGATPLPFLTALEGSAEAVLTRDGAAWNPTSVSAAVTLAGRGGFRAALRARTAAARVLLSGDARAGDARAGFEGAWPLAADGTGAGVVRIPQLTLSTVYTLLGREALPLDGRLEGEARVTGILLDPSTWLAELTLPRVEIAPLPGAVPPGMTRDDLTLRNQGDIQIVAGPSAIVTRRARFTAKDTELSGQGNVAFRRRNAWNLLLEGKVNLAVASTFRPDLVSAGTSTLTARLRGPLQSPDLDGRLELADASLFVRGLSNGLDQVNGRVRFDRGRINVERLTGQSGGGNVRLSGYLGFAPDLAYQLQAQLAQVRIRYPEGVSTTANASLALTGTRRRSLLSGSVTILRASLAPTTDMAALASGASSLASPPGDNDLLRGLQYDVRVETAQSAEFLTQLTRNVEADVDLRLRGSLDRPTLLGRVSITQGQLQFFGTDYTINRGEVEFRNPVRIDPQMDLDLETRVRGINVSLRFTGPPNKMNMSYRSDPPLQSSEILALLAVGRAPNLAGPTSGPGLNSRDLLTSGGSAILDSAVASGANSPLQRFFGVTRLKLDPQLIGLDNTPQARVSFEQQISRDVTVTYVQALNRAQQQLVRVQWDWNPEWSAIATRDENGVLSVDFVYKRSLR